MQHSAVTFKDHQGIELTLGPAVFQAPKMPPVHLHLLARAAFKSTISPALGGTSQGVQIIADNGHPAVKAFLLKVLQHGRCLYGRILSNDLLDDLAIGVKL